MPLQIMIKQAAILLTNNKILWKSFKTHSSVRVTYKIETHQEFETKVQERKRPTLITFHAKWCDKCPKVIPQMEDFLKDHNDIDIALVDVDTNEELVDRFNIKKVPTILAYMNGNVVAELVEPKDILLDISRLVSRLSS